MKRLTTTILLLSPLAALAAEAAETEASGGILSTVLPVLAGFALPALAWVWAKVKSARAKKVAAILFEGCEAGTAILDYLANPTKEKKAIAEREARDVIVVARK